MSEGRWEVALAVVLVLGGPGLAGCIGDTGRTVEQTRADTDPDRVPPSVWSTNLSTPAYDEIASRVVDLAAEDGTRLSLSVHLPADLPANASVPTLLTITPYQSFGVPHTDDSPATETGPAADRYAKYAERGAAVVVADARGTGGSGGCLDFGGPKDRADARTFVSWIRNQSWSNGEVVTDGVSHPGMGSLVGHVATDLTGALAHAPVVSYYRDEWYQGAKFEDQLNGPAYTSVESSPPLYTDPEALAAQADTCHADTMMDFGQVDGPFTDKWAKRDLARYTDDARDPLLLTQGFIDINVHPDHAQDYWEKLPDDAPAWLVMGWWYHGYPDMDGYGVDDFEQIRHRWLDRLLFDRDNGALDEPSVLVEDDEGTWHESPTWPLAPSATVTMNATPDEALAAQPAEEGEVTYRDDPRADRRNWGPHKALFTTEPLEEAKLVNGEPTVRLVGSSTAEATKWVAYLVELTDDGQMQRITHGYADSHTHGEEGTWQTMDPGQPYTWTIDLMPTAIVVDAGHRVGLLVASEDSRRTSDGPSLLSSTDQAREACWDYEQKRCYSPSGIVPADSAGRAENTVHTGPEGTQVTLAWTSPDATAKPPWSSPG